MVEEEEEERGLRRKRRGIGVRDEGEEGRKVGKGIGREEKRGKELEKEEEKGERRSRRRRRKERRKGEKEEETEKGNYGNGKQKMNKMLLVVSTPLLKTLVFFFFSHSRPWEFRLKNFHPIDIFYVMLVALVKETMISMVGRDWYACSMLIGLISSAFHSYSY